MEVEAGTSNLPRAKHVRGTENLEFKMLEQEIRDEHESERYQLERLLGQESLFLAYQIMSKMEKEEEEEESAWEKPFDHTSDNNNLCIGELDSI